MRFACRLSPCSTGGFVRRSILLSANLIMRFVYGFREDAYVSIKICAALPGVGR
jgi:hypothetical protein